MKKASSARSTGSSSWSIVTAPRSPRLQLKPFQQTGSQFLQNLRRALLADDMRLGKTVQALDAAKALGAQHVMVVCPGIAKMVWRTHAAKLDCRFAWFMVVSYEELRRYGEYWTSTYGNDILILDEAHFTKTASAQRTRAVWGKAKGVAHRSRYIWCLSGTPAPNHAGELWPMMRSFGATKMGKPEFEEYFCRLDRYGTPKGTRLDRVDELRGILSTFTLRRTKREVAPELPTLTIEPYPVEPSLDYLRAAWPGECDSRRVYYDNQDNRLYRELQLRKPHEQLEYLERHSVNLAQLRSITALLKAPRVAELIRLMLDNGITDKLVVFGYHRDPLKLLQRELTYAGYKSVIVYGGTSDEDKEKAVTKFTRKNGASVFIGNIESAGTAIDLSVANTAILLERDWVPGNNAQALDRMGGFNQKEPMTAYDMYIPNSADEIVQQVVDRKTHELSKVFDK